MSDSTTLFLVTATPSFMGEGQIPPDRKWSVGPVGSRECAELIAQYMLRVLVQSTSGGSVLLWNIEIEET